MSFISGGSRISVCLFWNFIVTCLDINDLSVGMCQSAVKVIFLWIFLYNYFHISFLPIWCLCVKFLRGTRLALLISTFSVSSFAVLCAVSFYFSVHSSGHASSFLIIIILVFIPFLHFFLLSLCGIFLWPVGGAISKKQRVLSVISSFKQTLRVYRCRYFVSAHWWDLGNMDLLLFANWDFLGEQRNFSKECLNQALKVTPQKPQQ